MYEIRLANKNDLSSLALIHKESYSKIHFTSYFSIELIKDYYLSFIENKNSKIFLAIKNEEIFGFIVCGKEIEENLKLFKANKRFSILKTIFLNPLASIKKINIDLFNRCFDVKVPFEETSFLILSIVSTNKEKGLGSYLLEYVKNHAIENKIFNIGLYVRISNITAINAYLKNSFKILGYASGQYYMEQNNS